MSNIYTWHIVTSHWKDLLSKYDLVNSKILIEVISHNTGVRFRQTIKLFYLFMYYFFMLTIKDTEEMQTEKFQF